MKKINVFLILLFAFMFFQCDTPLEQDDEILNFSLDEYEYHVATHRIEDHLDEEAIKEFNQSASLGRMLFYDTQLSITNTVSCASCHQQKNSFADDEAISTGFFQKKGTRNAMSIINLSEQTYMFWDGSSRVRNIETSILQPITNHVEMGFTSMDKVVTKLGSIAHYRDLFNQVYDRGVNEGDIGKSLANYVLSIKSKNSSFDKKIFTEEELSGMEVFNANCESCHTGDNFNNNWFANIGLDKVYEDEGRWNGQFKVPTLRNIELTAPYMHDGRFESLEEVVDFYNSGVQEHNFLDWRLRPNGNPIKMGLSEEEKENLVAFLHTLTDWDMVYNPKYSDPFN